MTTAITPPTEEIVFGPPDHTYLHLDTPQHPMHWAMLLELGESAPGSAPIALADIRERVAVRAGRSAVFRTGIVGGRWRRPRMIQVEEIDAHAQVSSSRYRDEDDLHSQIGTLMGAALERGRPFWHMTVFTPQAASGTAGTYVLLRVHHSLSDGIAGAAFSALLADGTDDDLAAFDRFTTSPRFSIRGIDPEQLATAKASFGDAWSAGEPGRNWPRLTRSGQREAVWHSVSTRELRRRAKTADATVHEFLLAAV